MLTPFRRTQTEDPEIRRLQDAAEASLSSVLDKRVIDGRLIEDVSLSSGDNTIEHKLGRTLRGWIVTRLSAAVDIYDKQSTNNLTDLNLVLNSSGTATVSLWVF